MPYYRPPNIKSEGGVLAVGCYTSSSGACGKTVVVSGRHDLSEAPSVTYATSISAATPSQVRPAFAIKGMGSIDSVDGDDESFVYAMDNKGASVSILKLSNGKVTTVNLPSLGSTIDMTRTRTHFSLDDAVVASPEEEGEVTLAAKPSLVLVRCTHQAQGQGQGQGRGGSTCASSTILLPSPILSGISVPTLSDTSLTCDGSGGVIVGAGRAPHSRHEGPGEDSLLCAATSMSTEDEDEDENGKHGVTVSSLNSSTSTSISTSTRIDQTTVVLPSSKRYGFHGWVYASCSPVLIVLAQSHASNGHCCTLGMTTRPSSRVFQGSNTPSPLLCIAVTLLVLL